MKLLVVEDERSIREFLKDGLEAEYFTVDTAEDGETGSLLARTNDYDAIILDNILPHKSGVQICSEIRERGKSVPVIILSVESALARKLDLIVALTTI